MESTGRLVGLVDYEDSDEESVKDSLESTLDVPEKQIPKCKSCFVKLERCDKIWETLELIKHLQESPDSQSNAVDHGDNLNAGEIHDTELMDDGESQSSQSNSAPYIKYQPVLNNGNAALPNFQFSVKSTRLLYQCHICGKQYSHRSTLRDHSKLVHKIILPTFTGKKRPDCNDVKYSSDGHEDIDIIDEIKEEVDDSLSDVSIKPEEINDGNMSICPYCKKEYKDKYYMRKHLRKVHGFTGQFNRSKRVNDDDDNNEVAQTKNSNVKNVHRVQQIENSTGLSVHRCTTCGKHFYLAQRLREHCRKTHGIYVRFRRPGLKPNDKKKKKIVKKSPTKIVKVEGETDGENGENGENESKDGIVKVENDNKVKSKPKLIAFDPRYYMDPKAPKCPVLKCNELFNDRTRWKDHCGKVHNLPVISRNTFLIETLHKNEDDRTCKYCFRQLTTVRLLIEHMVAVHKKITYYCDICAVKCSCVDNLVKHYFQYHNILYNVRLINTEKRKYSCSYCAAQYDDIRTFDLHSKYMHGCVQSQSTSPSSSSLPPIPAKLKSKCLPKNIRMTNNNKKFKASTKKLRKVQRINYEDLPSEADKSSVSSSSSESSTLNLSSKVKSPISKPPVKNQLSNPSIKNFKNLKIKNEVTTNESKVNTSGPVIVCFLCNRRCIRIKKHFVEYHKITNPGSLIDQCKPLVTTSVPAPTTTTETDNKVPTSSNSKVKSTAKKPIKTITIKSKRSSSNKSREMMSRYPTPGPSKLFELMRYRNNRYFYKCKVCDMITRNYRPMLNHERSHVNLNINQEIKSENDPPVAIKKENESPNKNTNSATVNTRKRKSLSADTFDVQRPRLTNPDPPVVKTRATRSSMRINPESAPEIEPNLTTSKPSPLSASLSDDNSSNSINDTQENSDRDSGIGISITIKKKNDSYEIVNREQMDERIVRCSPSLPEFKPVIFNSVSNKTPTDKAIDLKYSKDHEVLKIEKSEDDIDVDMEDFTQNLFPSLRQLCRKILDTNKIDYNPSECYKEIKPNLFICKECGVQWNSFVALIAHSRVHKRR